MTAAAMHEIHDIDGSHVILRRYRFRRQIRIETVLMGISLPEPDYLLQLRHIRSAVFDPVRRSLVRIIRRSADKFFLQEVHRIFGKQRGIVRPACLVSR